MGCHPARRLFFGVPGDPSAKLFRGVGDNLKPVRRSLSIAATSVASLLFTGAASAQNLTFSLTWGWQGDARQDAAWWAFNNTVNRFNAYGDFTGGNGSNVQAAYNPGVPTAQAGYGGWGGIIEYGGTWPNDRVTQHEMYHWLGGGTFSAATGQSWHGPRANRIMAQFEGEGARVGTDGTHFWPYGLNYDSEWSELNARRGIALMYALRADWGIGSTANPRAWNATSVNLTRSDNPGQSGFNHYETWSDGTFAHRNADYSTGAFDLRTPGGYQSWTFEGKSLTVNNAGRLLYNSWGHDGRITIKNLNLAGGTVRQDQNDGNPNTQLDTFRLAGNVNLIGNGTFDAAQGDIYVESRISGNGSLNKTGSYALTLQAANDYAGATNINQGTLKVSPTTLVGNYTFDNVSGSTVVNSGSGSNMNGTLTGGATVVAAGGGRDGNAVRVQNGASVDINSGITNLAPDGNWAVNAWIKTGEAGGTILSKSDNGWDNGNTVFYLGDGDWGGSGAQPAGVRFAGGFLHAQPGQANLLDDQWHQVTYVNTGGTYTIYVDGQPLSTSAAHAGFGNDDIGGLVKLGATTNTIAGDGTRNFNGLLDDVQFYGQSLSAAQVAALHQGKTLGSLPTTTTVNMAASTRLELGGVAQEIAGLNGPSSATVALGIAGQLIVGGNADSTFNGTISSPVNGSLVKSGAGRLTLNGTSSYNFQTRVIGGTLEFNGTHGVNLGYTVEAGATLAGTGSISGPLNLAGTLEVDLADADPIAFTGTVTASGNVTLFGDLPLPNESVDVIGYGNFSGDLTVAGDPSLPGLLLDFVAGSGVGRVEGSALYAGDANLDAKVDLTDFVILRNHFNQSGNWLAGDFTGDGRVDLADFVVLRNNFGSGGGNLMGGLPSIPEPGAVSLLLLGGLALRRRRDSV